ncbi:hypothetical protein FQR65_LT03538 [Abscondita terminalis]|nr:hypothetical protein FQR65_LT03538 [Abscondita terminalis]
MLDWTLSNYQTTPTIVTAVDRRYKPPAHPATANVIIAILENADFINATLDQLVKRSFFTYRSYVFFVLAEERLQVLAYNPFKSSKLENFTNAAAYTQMFHNKVKQMNGHVIRGGTVEDVPRAVYRNGQLYVTDKNLHSHSRYDSIMKKIMEEKLDCAFITQFWENLDEFDPEKKLQYSNPYSLDAILIILPRPKYIPTYLNIFFIFQGTLWIFLIVTCVLITLATALLDRMALKIATIRTSEDPVFQTIRIMINLPSSAIQKTILSKKLLFLFSVWLTFFFHILFNSYLTSTLIKPKRYARITTLKELSESEYKIYFYWKDLAERSSSWPILRDRYIFESKSEMFKMIMGGNDNYGYGCNSLQSADIFVRRSTNKHRKGLFYVLKEALVPGHRAFVFPKNSPYLSTINNYLLMYKEFKIHQDPFANLDVKKNLIPEESTDVFKNRKIKNVVLTLGHMQTCFYILCLGLTVSFLVFVGEVLIKKYKIF